MNNLITEEDYEQLGEKILNKSLEYDCGFIYLENVEVELPNKQVTNHKAIRHHGAVALLVLNDKNEILLVKQYRTAVEEITLEIPAGKIDKGESLEEAGLRELSEETGYTAGTIKHVTSFWPAVGYCNEMLHIYKAEDLTPGPTHPDENEFLGVIWVDKDELFELARRGEIKDSKTLIGLFCLKGLFD